MKNTIKFTKKRNDSKIIEVSKEVYLKRYAMPNNKQTIIQVVPLLNGYIIEYIELTS